MNSIRLYIQFVRLSIRSQMVYKASFIFGSIGHFFITVIEFVGILALFDRFGGINGWTLPEIALFYGTVNASFALAESFGRGYDLFSHQVVSGRFDRLILRPRSFMLQLMGVEVQLIRVGRLLQGLAIMIWACVTLHINLLSVEVIIIIMTIIGCMFLFLGLFVIQATMSFWTIQSLEVVNAFTYGGVQLAQYPVDIYKKWFQKIFIYIIPIATVSYFPLLVVLGKSDMVSLPIPLITAMPLVGIFFFVMTQIFFRVGVLHYKSTGS